MLGPWRRRRILDRIERGDLAFGDLELERELQRDPVLAARVLERRNQEVALRAGDDTRKAREGGPRIFPSSGLLDGPAAAAPADQFEGALYGPPPGSRRHPRSRLATWISVALLAGAAGMFLSDVLSPPTSEATAEPASRRILGRANDTATRLQLRLPEARVDAFGTIAFDAPLRPGGWFRIEVRPADAPPDAPPLLLFDRTEERAWTPSAPQLATLPPAIQITVRAYDASGTEVEATTSRSEVNW